MTQELKRAVNPKPGHCHACGIEIPDYPETVGGRGFISQMSDEIKLTQADGMKALESVHRVVCKPCYIKEWKMRFPDLECPIK
jgi:hypothetical protein